MKEQPRTRVCDYIIVGAGPAGVFAAMELLKLHPERKVLVIERGKRVENRFCPASKAGKCIGCKPYCNIMNGFSGAGAFSDGKLSLFNPEDDDFYVGGNLHKYAGVNVTKRLITETDKMYLKFGADTKLQGVDNPGEISKIRKTAEIAGLDLVNIPIRHLGTDRAHLIYQKIENHLEEMGAEILFETEVKDLLIEDGKIHGVIYKEKKGEESEALAETVIIAVGRVGANWLLKICEKHAIKTEPGILDVGIRYELPDKVMKRINDLLYEGKFIGKPAPYNDKVRTFCQNPSGFVTTEVYDEGIILVNGHSLKDTKSENTNLAILVSMNLKDMPNPMEYSRNIARNMNALAGGNVIVQRLGDIMIGKRTWPDELSRNSVIPTLKSASAGDLSLAMPYRELMDILGFIEMMDKVAPGFANADNLLYGPELKFYSNKLELSTSLETSIHGLYAIGDGCGLTRGLMMASASGVYVARQVK